MREECRTLASFPRRCGSGTLHRWKARMRIVLLLAVVLALSCTKVGEVPPSQLPPYLRPLPGAKNVDARRLGPEAGVAYSLAACYPATAELRLIAERISPTWTPRTEDYL